MKDNWNELTIGNEINFLGGFPFSSAKFNEEGVGVPLIRIRDLLKSSQVTYFSGSYSNSYLINEEDILIGMDGDFHIVKWKNSPSLLNQRILKVSGKKSSEIDLDFLFYYLKPFLLDVHNKTAATTVKHLSTFDVSRAVDLFPPLPQQKKIAKILSTVDTVIEQTQTAIAKYQAIKQGLMHDVFTRGIDVNTGELRPTPEEAPELYKESVLGLIPLDWEEITYGDEINFLSGFPFASVFFNEEKKGKPLIRIRDLLNSSQETYYNGAYSDSYLIKEGDVLIGMDGDFHIIKWKNSASLLNQRILKISEKKDGKLYLDYFFYYLFPFLLDVHNKTAATTVKHLSTKDISGATRFMPLKSEQILSAKKILSIESKIQTEQQALAKYQKLKAGLMQDLLTGKVEVGVD